MGILRHWFRKIRIACAWKHTSIISGKPTKRIGFVTILGRTCFVTRKGPLEYTLDEYAQAVIVCVGCKAPIVPGESIRLLSKKRRLPPHAQVHGPDGNPIACTRCAELPCDGTALWVMDRENPGQGQLDASWFLGKSVLDIRPARAA